MSFKIGATLPLSGELSTYGKLILSGIELAKNDLMDQGIKLDLIVEDTPLNGSGIIPIIDKMITINKIDAVAGNFSNQAMFLMGNYLEKNKIAAFHTAAVDSHLEEFPKYILSTNTLIQDEAENLASYLYNKGYREIGVITILNHFGISYRDFFESKFKSLGGKIVESTNFQMQDNDYRSQILKLKSKNPEVIFAACFGGYLGRILKQSKQLGISTPFYSVYESEDSSVLESSEGFSNGLRYFVAYSKNNKYYLKFRDKFFTRFKKEPDTFATNAYDATMLLGSAFKKCNDDKDCLINELYSTKNYNGASGTISINQNGIAKKDFILKEIQNDQFVEVQE